MTRLFLGRCNTDFLFQDRELMTKQHMNTTKFQLEETVRFIGVTFRNVGEGLIIGAEIIQRQLNVQSLAPHR